MRRLMLGCLLLFTGYLAQSVSAVSYHGQLRCQETGRARKNVFVRLLEEDVSCYTDRGALNIHGAGTSDWRTNGTISSVLMWWKNSD